MKDFVFFITSFIICWLFGLIEALLGLGNGLHPDSIYYIENSNDIVFDIVASEDLTLIFNNGYYFLVSYLGSSSVLLILINQLVYSVTNVLMSKAFSRFGVFQLFLCFAPYRLHLANHVLKDTIIIFTAVLFLFTTSRCAKAVGLFLSILFRLISPVYYLSLFQTKRLIGWTLIFFIALIIIPELSGFFMERNDVDMAGREYDLVPNFSFFPFGYFLRFIFWPIIGLSGLTIFLVRTVSILPLAFELVIFGWKMRNRLMSFYIIAGVVAMLVTTYTSFLRYIYPLIWIYYFKFYEENWNIRNTRSSR